MCFGAFALQKEKQRSLSAHNFQFMQGARPRVNALELCTIQTLLSISNLSQLVKMFKRVEKRRRKQEEEEALGVTEEMKEIMGRHDTDTDESMSSDDDDSEDGGEEEQEEEEEEEGDEGEEEELSDEQDESEEDDVDEDEDEPIEPSISVSDALADPLYIVSLDPELQACIVCPGKILKNAIVIEEHKRSQVHIARIIHHWCLSRG